jgi:hypothetical protein
MSVILPKEINYAQPASLPENTQCYSIVTAPSNGASFQQSSIVQFDMVTRGFVVPESIYLRYKMVVTGGTAAGAQWLRGTPCYTPISRLELIVGSSVVESIQNYNQLSNMVVNCKMNYAQKIGLANAFGYTSAVTGAYNFDLQTALVNGSSMSTCTNAVLVTQSFACPLGCLLSNADNLVPLKYLPGCRIQLTLESIQNAFQVAGLAAAQIQSYTLSNMELCYDIIEFSPLVDQAISSRDGGRITIKSQSYISSGSTLTGGSSGSLEFVFNSRLASIKSLFAHLSGTVTTASTNGLFDSVDATINNGAYSFTVAGTQYPPRELSTILNKAGISMELSNAFGPAHDLITSNFSIHPTEFNYTNTSTTTQNLMGKFYVGTNCERLSTNSALLTGISSQGSPITFRITLGTATTNAQVIQLICLYDALLQIDMNTKTLQVMQ